MGSSQIVTLLLPATHTPTIPAFTAQPQSVTALWVVLIAPTHEGMARLSWPGSHTETNVPHREVNPDTVTHSSTNRTVTYSKHNGTRKTHNAYMCFMNFKCQTFILMKMIETLLNCFACE